MDMRMKVSLLPTAHLTHKLILFRIVAFEQEEEEDFLGEAKKRNPEYKPFDSPFLNLIAKCSGALDILNSRSFMYALKAAVLGALTTLPNFIA